MRTVTLLGIVLATLLTAFLPAQAAGVHDECVTSAPGGIACQEIHAPVTLGSPVPDPTYYVWFGPGKCIDGLQGCRGDPGGERDEDVPLPIVFSVLYKESNGLQGLQRSPIHVGDRLFPADETVLV